MATQADSAPLLPSHEIPVGHFELALVWPVFIQPRRNARGEWLEPWTDPQRPDFLNQWILEIKKAAPNRWHDVNSEYPPLHGDEAEQAYSEFCYFHPFVRHFLYSNRDDIRFHAGRRPITDADIRKTRNRNLRILERNDLDELIVEYEMQPTLDDHGEGGYQELRTHFQIELCWLYLFDTQAAILELKLKHLRTEGLPEPTVPNLRVILRLQDIVRRAYAPYWSVFPLGRELVHSAGHCPRRLELVFKRQAGETQPRTEVSTFGNYRREDLTCEQMIACDEKTDRDGSTLEHRGHVFRHREPYTENVFRELLSPIQPAKTQSNSRDSVLQYEHIEDERIPTFSYVAVSEPRKIFTGDWMRLATLDDEGDSSLYPYSPEFCGENPLAGFAYDRFWHSTGQPPGQDAVHSTRWLCSGYGFVGVGKHDPDGCKFFSNEHDGALAHFRHHYFALGMIAHFQRASLLRFKHALAEAASHLLDVNGSDRDRRAEFRADTDRLMKEFLRFRTLYWFSEVSNQIQGRELFELFGRHLRLQPLFDEVSADIDNAATLLRNWDAEEQTRTTQLLTIVAALFLALTPALEQLTPVNGSVNPWWVAGSLFSLLLGLVLIFMELPRVWKGLEILTREQRVVRWCCAAVLILAGLLGMAYCVSASQRPKQGAGSGDQSNLESRSNSAANSTDGSNANAA